MRSILIATTPRTGSWLLCDGLRQSGAAGRTEEYAGPQDLATWRDHLGYASHAEYFSKLHWSLATPNNTRSLKLMLGQYRQFEHDARHYGLAGATGLDMLRELLGSYVVLRLHRRDRLAQAISWFRADRTGEWSRTSQSSAAPAPEFDGHAIVEAMKRLEADNAIWTSILAGSGLDVVALDYEDLCQDFDGSVRRVMNSAGIGVPANIRFEPRLRRQADYLSEVWGGLVRAQLAGDTSRSSPPDRSSH